MTGGGAADRGVWAARLGRDGTPPAAVPQLAEFLALLERWGGAMDLVAGADPAGLLASLVRDTLAALPFLPAEGSLLDVGSGNGFPAVPLLVARPALRGVLLEPRERRWAFLKEVVRELGLAAEVRRERVAEHAGGGYNVATVRGVGLDVWSPHAARLVHQRGAWLWWTSADRAAALAAQQPEGRVLPFALASGGGGVLAVWRPCFT